MTIPSQFARIGYLLSTILSAAAMIVCVSCVGPIHPMRYYSLERPAASPAPNSNPIPVTILVGRVTGSHLYRDDRVVFGNGTGELGLYETQRWVETPIDMMEAVILQTLRASGRFRTVQPMGSDAVGDYIVRGHLISLDEIDAVPLVARFSIELDLFDRKTGTTVWTGTYTHDEPVNEKTVAAVVEAFSRNVHTGIDQLTTSLTDYCASHPLPEAPARP
jgi:ABC-type uncharacterized transport system auxiliary subunit